MEILGYNRKICQDNRSNCFLYNLFLSLQLFVPGHLVMREFIGRINFKLKLDKPYLIVVKYQYLQDIVATNWLDKIGD